MNLESRVADDPFYRFLERTWMLQQLPPAIILFILGGWAFVCWGVCARVTAGVLGHWLIGHFAHNHGGMSYVVDGAAVQGKNVRFVSLLTMGECWHNNHHAFPGSAKLGLHPGEWDPGWWTLQALRRLGLAWAFQLPDDLAPRANLHSRRTPTFASLNRSTWHLSGPAKWLPESLFQRVSGGRFILSDSSRLVLHGHRGQLTGFPALMIGCWLNLSEHSGANNNNWLR